MPVRAAKHRDSLIRVKAGLMIGYEQREPGIVQHSQHHLENL